MAASVILAQLGSSNIEASVLARRTANGVVYAKAAPGSALKMSHSICRSVVNTRAKTKDSRQADRDLSSIG